MRQAGIVQGSSLIGAHVRNTAGAEIGRVEELVIEPSGAVCYAIVSSPFVTDDRLLAIPWSALSTPAGQDYLVLNRDRSFLERAPAFDRGRWPDLTEPSWRRQVDDYYGYTPVAGEDRIYARRPIGFGAVIAVLLLVLMLGFFYMVYTTGWRQTQAAVVDSVSSVAYAAKETSQDAALTAKVKTALSLSRRIPAWNINVDSHDGVVTLQGEAPDGNVKALAEDITKDTDGVKSVRNELTVNPAARAAAEMEQMQNRVNDLETRYAVRDAFAKDPTLRVEDIDVQAAGGAVTLNGSVVTSEEKFRAEQVARATPGVRSVQNDLEVLQR